MNIPTTTSAATIVSRKLFLPRFFFVGLLLAVNLSSLTLAGARLLEPKTGEEGGGLQVEFDSGTERMLLGEPLTDEAKDYGREVLWNYDSSFLTYWQHNGLVWKKKGLNNRSGYNTPLDSVAPVELVEVAPNGNHLLVYFVDASTGGSVGRFGFYGGGSIKAFTDRWRAVGSVESGATYYVKIGTSPAGSGDTTSMSLFKNGSNSPIHTISVAGNISVLAKVCPYEVSRKYYVRAYEPAGAYGAVVWDPDRPNLEYSNHYGTLTKTGGGNNYNYHLNSITPVRMVEIVPSQNSHVLVTFVDESTGGGIGSFGFYKGGTIKAFTDQWNVVGSFQSEEKYFAKISNYWGHTTPTSIGYGTQLSLFKDGDSSPVSTIKKGGVINVLASIRPYEVGSHYSVKAYAEVGWEGEDYQYDSRKGTLTKTGGENGWDEKLSSTEPVGVVEFTPVCDNVRIAFRDESTGLEVGTITFFPYCSQNRGVFWISTGPVGDMGYAFSSGGLLSVKTTYKDLGGSYQTLLSVFSAGSDSAIGTLTIDGFIRVGADIMIREKGGSALNVGGFGI